MRSEAPALLPIFRSPLQAQLLAMLLLNPGEEHTATELARRFDAPLTTVHQLLRQLVDAGLLVRRAVGRTSLLSADQGNPLVGPLTELLMLTWGPQQVVAEEFADLPGMERVLIFGSWAARFRQTPGPPPRDVDVLVIGEAERGAVYDAADRAQRRLGMPVNPVLRTGAQWTDDAPDPLVRQIRSTELVEVLPLPAGTERAS
jgi:DNA-binding transcriptional ArsR family regulator